MKVVYNSIIPFKGFYAITIIKWIFIRNEYKYLDRTNRYTIMLNHEGIHEQQILDFTPKCFPNWLKYIIGSIFFYLLYLLEWLIKLIPASICKKNAYKSISFEQEAYNNENELTYIKYRNKRNWIKNIFKLHD